MNRPKPAQGAARIDNESPGDSGQLPPPRFAEFIAGNQDIPGQESPKLRRPRQKTLIRP